MCWKQEWATAIGNINKALAHSQKAKEKLEQRVARNQATIEKVKDNPRRSDILKQATATKHKWEMGVKECKEIIDELKEQRLKLLFMVGHYGIKQSASTQQRTIQLMGKCKLCKSKADTLKELPVCVQAPYCTWNKEPRSLL